MSRRVAAVAYLAAALTATYTLAALAVRHLSGTTQALAFIVTALSVASLAGALTPHWANPYTRKDDSQ